MSRGALHADAETVAARRPGALFLVFALLAAAGVLLGAPPWFAALVGAPVLLVGAAFPWLVLRAPDESSALKLALFAGLLSPAIAAALFIGGLLLATPALALAATFLIIAASQLFVGRRRVSTRRPARAEWMACALGALLAAAVFALHSTTPELRLFGDGMWYAGRAGALAGGALSENPWMAGSAGIGPAPYEALLAVLARGLQLDTSFAAVLLSGWAALLLPIAMYFLAAPLWAEPRRVVGSMVLALLGWNALGGLWWWSRGQPELHVLGGGLVLGATASTPPIALGWPVIALPGPAAPALALAVGAWVAAGHALQHARAPWVELCGALHGLALWVDPGVGLPAILATGAAAAIAPADRAVRPLVLASLALGALPAIALWDASTAVGPASVGLSALNPAEILAGAGLLVVGAALLMGAHAPRAQAAPARRARFGLVLAGIFVAAPIAWWVSPSEAGVLLVAVAAGALAAGGLGRGLEGGWRRWAALALGSAIAVGGVAAGMRSAGALTRLRHTEPGFSVQAGRLELRPRRAQDAGRSAYELLMERAGAPLPTRMAVEPQAVEAYAFLREWAAGESRRPVLFLSAAREGQRAPISPWVHPAPLQAELSVWADRSEPQARADSTCADRVQLARGLFDARPEAVAAITRALDRLDRSGVVWVGAAEREARPGLDEALLRAGFTECFRSGELALYVLDLSAGAGS